MRALTIKQPWAWAIAHGSKRIENRSWPTAYRGEIAIHAGARSGWDHVAEDSPLLRQEWRRLGHLAAHLERNSEWIDFGAVIAVARIADCHDGALEQGECSDWANRWDFHWVLAQVRPLTDPVPCRGALGLWRLPGDVEAAVRAQADAEAGAFDGAPGHG